MGISASPFFGGKKYNKCRSFEGGVGVLLKGIIHSSGADENGVGGGSAQASQSTPERKSICRRQNFHT
jgi:hypothetical protein